MGMPIVGKLALEGIKVADFTWVVVGPATTKYLADQGATVVHVESHTRPDPIRVSAPFKDGVPGIDRSGYFTYNNSSKYGISLDLNKPRGQEIGQKLIAWADVVVENFRPGAMHRWGLDYDMVNQTRPDIVYLSASMQGQYGPYSTLPGLGPLANAFAGIYHLSGWPDRGPAAVWGPYTDFVSPRFAVAAIMAALHYRRKTGKGQHIDISQVETVTHLFAPLVMDYTVNRRVANRDGNHLAWAAPHGIYPCKGEDHWCAIGVFTDEDWCAFTRIIGETAWATDPRFASLSTRKEHEEELDRLVGAWTVQYTAEQVEAMMQSAGIAASTVENSRDLFEDPQLKHRGSLHYMEHPVIGRHAYGRPAFRLSKTPDRQSAAPALGQHNEYVCKQILGLSDDEIAQLLVDRVLTTEADLPPMAALM